MTGPAAAPIPCRKRQKTRPPIEEEIAHPKAAIVNTVHPASKAGRRPSRSHNGPKMSCPTPKPAMNKLRINAVAVGCARSEMPIFVRDARHESIESEGNMTTVASRTMNSFESLGILNGTENRGRFGSLITGLVIYFRFLLNCATMVLKIPEEDRSVKRWEFGVRDSAFGVRGSGFGVRGSGFGVRSSEFGVRSSEFGVRGSEVWDFGVWGLEFGVWSLGFGVRGLEFGVWSLEFGL